MVSQITSIFKKYSTLPVLFIGAGVSRRYLGISDWKGLLKMLAGMLSNDPFIYDMYAEKAKVIGYRHGLLPKVAELIEIDFNDKWFSDTSFRAQHAEYVDEVQKSTLSPFKAEISLYMKKASLLIKPEYQDEIDFLKKVGEKSIGGVITTNYDLLLEAIYSSYDKYIGQDELLFSSLKGVAEIYKIHGCCTKPNSIVINENDYSEFIDKNTYLAAKLLTIFLEHPIVFLGYSITDKNIENILKAIVKALPQEKLMTLKERLFFIEWNTTTEPDSISVYSKAFDDGKSIDMTRIVIEDFSILYKALLGNNAKYNTKLLRQLQNDIYELVMTNKPTSRTHVMALDDDKLDDVEIVIGVGVIAKVGEIGYTSISAVDLYRDIVFDSESFDSKCVVQLSIPRLLPFNHNSVPIYKYIKGSGINEEDLPIKVSASIKRTMADFLSTTLKKEKARIVFKERSVKGVIAEYSSNKALQNIALLNPTEIDTSELRTFLQSYMTDNETVLCGNDALEKTSLKRLIRIYDWLVYYRNK